jgi:hypothetical protein
MFWTNGDGSLDEQGCRESFGPLGEQEAPPKQHSTEAPNFFTNKYKYLRSALCCDGYDG